VRASGGDYMPSDLERAIDTRYLMANVVSETLRLAPDRSKVVFAGSVLHSQKLAAAFSRKGVEAAHLDGETPADERERMLDDLRARRLEMICNYDVLSEGWDLPDLGAVVLARPFRSLARYLQCVGRGMRWRKGERPLVLDFGDNAPRFGLWPGDDVAWTIDGRPKGERAPLWKQCEGCQARIPLSATTCPECGHACPIERARKEREEADAKLEEATRAEYQALRARVELMALKKNAPAGVDREGDEGDRGVKSCQACGEKLYPRHGEAPSQFEERVTCGGRCGILLRAMSRAVRCATATCLQCGRLMMQRDDEKPIEFAERLNCSASCKNKYMSEQRGGTHTMLHGVDLSDSELAQMLDISRKSVRNRRKRGGSIFARYHRWNRVPSSP
jgi:superfamily II DNA/RNA helicase